MPACPQCRISLVNKVPKRGLLEYFLSFLSIGPFRCQLCTHRFLGLKWWPSTNLGREYNRIQSRYPVRLTPNLRGRPMGAESDQIQQEEATLLDISIRGCAIKTNASLHKGGFVRSEEHTSELQSLAYLVCRLLLEKKKKAEKTHNVTAADAIWAKPPR